MVQYTGIYRIDHTLQYNTLIYSTLLYCSVAEFRSGSVGGWEKRTPHTHTHTHTYFIQPATAVATVRYVRAIASTIRLIIIDYARYQENYIFRF